MITGGRERAQGAAGLLSVRGVFDPFWAFGASSLRPASPHCCEVSGRLYTKELA